MRCEVWHEFWRSCVVGVSWLRRRCAAFDQRTNIYLAAGMADAVFERLHALRESLPSTSDELVLRANQTAFDLASKLNAEEFVPQSLFSVAVTIAVSLLLLYLLLPSAVRAAFHILIVRFCFIALPPVLK